MHKGEKKSFQSPKEEGKKRGEIVDFCQKRRNYICKIFQSLPFFMFGRSEKPAITRILDREERGPIKMQIVVTFSWLRIPLYKRNE